MKMNEMPNMNKFQPYMTQLNESEVRELKWISVKLRECNLYFSQ